MPWGSDSTPYGSRAVSMHSLMGCTAYEVIGERRVMESCHKHSKWSTAVGNHQASTHAASAPQASAARTFSADAMLVCRARPATMLATALSAAFPTTATSLMHSLTTLPPCTPPPTSDALTDCPPPPPLLRRAAAKLDAPQGPSAGDRSTPAALSSTASALSPSGLVPVASSHSAHSIQQSIFIRGCWLLPAASKAARRAASCSA